MTVRPSIRAAVRAALLALACAASLAAAPTPASAGEYHVWLCYTPSGHLVETNTGVSPMGDVWATQSGCDGVNWSAIWLPGGVPAPGGNGAAFKFISPAGAEFVRLELLRAVEFKPGPSADVSAQPEYRLYRDDDANPANVLERCTSAATCFANADVGAVGTWDFHDRPASSLTFQIACKVIGAPVSSSCAKPAQTYEARVRASLGSAHFTVRENTPPTGQTNGPATETDRAHSGTEIVNVEGKDSGAGVFQAFARIDGVEVGRLATAAAVSSPAARATSLSTDPSLGCEDRGNVFESELDFEALFPCPGRVVFKLPVDTTKVPDGTRHLKVYVRDAAGNEGLVGDHTIRIVNGIPDPNATPVPTATPAVVNGTPGRIVLDAKKSALAVRTGKSATVTGALVDAGGAPIGGATVSVSEQLAVLGAAWTTIGRVTTDAQGRFSYYPTTTASRTLRFSYAFAPGVAASQTVPVKVTAAISIRPGTSTVRRGRSVKLSGTVTLAHLPAKGATLEIQVLSAGKWQSIDRAKVSKAGRWSWTYKLTRSTHTAYKFRAFLRSGEAVPAEDSASATANVRVRR